MILERLPGNPSNWYIFVEPYGLGDCLANLSLFGSFRHRHCRDNEKICYVTISSLGNLQPLVPNIVDLWLTFPNNLSVLLYLYNEIIPQKYSLEVSNPVSLAPSGYRGLSSFVGTLPSEHHFTLKKLLLGLSPTTPFQLSSRKFSDSEDFNYRSKFFRNGLDPSLCVLIIPHAQSCAKLPQWYWDYLVQKLHSAGFFVFFDIYTFYTGAPSGAVECKLSLSEIVFLARNIGCVITYRSGITDLVAIMSDKVHFCLYPSKDLLLHGYAESADIRLTTTNYLFDLDREISFFETISTLTDREQTPVLRCLDKVALSVKQHLCS